MSTAPISTCHHADGCCFPGCNATNDDDCAVPGEIWLSPIERGSYSENGEVYAPHDAMTGYAGGQAVSSFFSFDLNQVHGTIASARLALQVDIYDGKLAGETVSLRDVTTPLAKLTAFASDPNIFEIFRVACSMGN